MKSNPNDASGNINRIVSSESTSNISKEDTVTFHDDDSDTKSESSLSSSDSKSNSSKGYTFRPPGITREMKDEDIENICDEFKYDLMEKIIKTSSVYKDEITGLFIASKSHGFIHLGYTGNEINPNYAQLTRGWKLHIAIRDENKNNLENGWNTLLPIIIKYKLIVKVVNSDEYFYKKNEHGKQVTIYYFNTPDRQWQNILNEMENALEEAKIVPDVLPDKPILYPVFRDSNFISYIHDGPNSVTYQPTAVIVDQDGNKDFGPFIQYEAVHFHLESKEDLYPEVKCDIIENNLKSTTDNKNSDENVDDETPRTRLKF